MKKHHFIKMSSIALSLCVALGTFPATAFADDANATTITKAYFTDGVKDTYQMKPYIAPTAAELEQFLSSLN